MGKLHSLAVTSYPMYFKPVADIRKVCFADIDEDAAKEAKQRYGYDEWTTDWRAMVAREDVDVVDIGTPNIFHKEMVLEALKSKKHIFCEKPLGMNAKDAKEMYEAAESAGIVHAVGHNNRSIPAVQMIKRLMDRGEFGDIFSIQMRYIQDWAISEDTPMQWRFDIDVAGSGALGDIGSHALDIARFLIGDIASVNAQSRTIVKERNVVKKALLGGKPRPEDITGTKEIKVDDETQALVKFKNGVTGTLQASRFCLGHKDTLDIEVYGSKGAARFSRERPNELSFYSGSDPADIQGYRTIKMGPEHPYGNFWVMADLGIGYNEQKCAEFSRFFEAIADGDKSKVAVSFYDGYKVCQLVDAITQSAVKQEWVTLSD